ncbi:Rab11 Family-Interacting Protein 3 [Manis pentadactyla]|nr:Rab11 Family-Interacting Protein 3 [Manis pentadactyla]
MRKMGLLSAMPVVSGIRNMAPGAPAAGWCPGKISSPRGYVADAGYPWAPTKAQLRMGIPGGRPRPQAPGPLSQGVNWPPLPLLQPGLAERLLRKCSQL